MKIFIFDPMWDDLMTSDLALQLSNTSADIKIIKEICPLNQTQDLFTGVEERILCLNPDYVQWKLESTDYEKIPNLKAILIASTSYSWVDMRMANLRHIPVCNIKGFSTESVAEWAIGMMFAVARQIPMLIKANFPLDYNQDYFKYRGLELKGKTVGIIGLGAIGSAIAERCLGLGMNVAYWSPKTRSDKYQFMEIDQLLPNVDVLFPTMAPNPESKKILSDERIKLISKQAILISIVHNLFNQQLVIEMVQQNKLFGYGYEAAPESFYQLEGNIWAAPAYAWATVTAMEKSMRFWVENMIAAINGNYPNRVN